MIDLGTLASLRAVEQHGTVAAAADALGFTPSAVSQQVKRLERQAGTALLERVGRGVVLTRAGRYLVEEGVSLLADVERIESGLRRSSGRVEGRLRLAVFSTATRGLVAPVLRTLHETYPDLAVRLVEHEPWETVDLVARGLYDVGLVHSWGDVPLTTPDHVVRTRLRSDRADVVVHREHRLAEAPVVTPADLVEETWVATHEGTICRAWLDRMYQGTGRAPVIGHVAAEFDSHLAVVRAGLAIALVPRLGRSPLGDDLVAVTATDPDPTRQVLAVHRASMADSPAVGALLSALAAAGAGAA